LKATNKHSIYNFTIKGLKGDEIDFSQFKGKKLLIVNTASECGFTPQYQQLQELYEYFHNELVVICCPSNDFGNQEPGDESDIATFCENHYGVTFPMTKKIQVKGSNKHPLYQWLTNKELNQQQDSDIQWNFQKYLIDEEGQLLEVLPPSVDPVSEEVINVLQES